jgi:PPOX class probable F420-dependent enzyme
MPTLRNPVLAGTVREIVAGPHLSVLATTNPDGQPQTSVIFVTLQGDDIVFSTIKGRRKTSNMQRDPRANLLLHRLADEGRQPAYVTVSGTVELTDDPGGKFHQVMYDIYMGGATPPPEPGAERVIVRLIPQRLYGPPPYVAGE